MRDTTNFWDLRGFGPSFDFNTDFRASLTVKFISGFSSQSSLKLEFQTEAFKPEKGLWQPMPGHRSQGRIVGSSEKNDGDLVPREGYLIPS
jgi:hypothetical protein